MYCLHCRQRLPDDADACPSCGKVFPTDEWEVCQIVRVDSTKGISFWADGEDNHGHFRAGETNQVSVQFQPDRGIGTSVAVELHQALVNQLERDNWEVTGRGEHWWETQFRRRAQRE
jgi:hypothetical protein